jgi:hypothetical protein
MMALEPGGMTATAGSRCQTPVDSRTTSSIPMTNSGIAVKTTEVTSVDRSTRPSRRIAVKTPRKTESGRAMTAVIASSVNEFHTAGVRVSLTARCVARDVPQSPWRIPVTQDRYCCGTERSRWSASRSRSRFSGVASRPRMARAGSPGSA